MFDAIALVWRHTAAQERHLRWFDLGCLRDKLRLQGVGQFERERDTVSGSKCLFAYRRGLIVLVLL